MVSRCYGKPKLIGDSPVAGVAAESVPGMVLAALNALRAVVADVVVVGWALGSVVIVVSLRDVVGLGW